MNTMKKIIIYTVAALLISGLTGCKEWLDINTNPNDPTTEQMSEAIMLPAQQYRILNNHVNSTYAWQLSHYLTKSGEYSGNYTFLNGQVMPQNLDSWWQTYYYINWNLKYIHDLAVENEDLAYQAITEILQVINFQRMVDIWGDIPYSQAINPDEYTNPVYDKAQDIYADLIDRAHTAAEMFDSIKDNYVDGGLSGVDIICHGDLGMWSKLAYTVELRLLMRVSGVQDVKEKVNAIYTKCLGINENIEGNPGYIAQDDKMNIFFQNYGWDKNINATVNLRQYCPTSVLVDMLRDNNDPRLRVYVDPRAELGDDVDGFANYSAHGLENEYYVGIPYGQDSPAGIERTATTGTGLLAGGSDRSAGMLRPSLFIAGSEVGFLLAEAALKGIISGDAKQYYEDAVKSAMKRHEAAMQEPSENFQNYLSTGPITGMKPPITGTAEEAAEAYLSQRGSQFNWDELDTDEEKMNAICSQKWLAFMGYNPMEAWFEQRRTDLPVLPASYQGLRRNQNFCILPYPQTERNLNMANIPYEADIYSTLVFWDEKNPTVPETNRY